MADILMPIITFFIPGGTWRDATLNVGPIVLSVTSLGALLDYLIIALIVFYLMKVLRKTALK